MADGVAGASPLKNAKQERFCQLLVSGENQTRAYVLAGYSQKGATTHAARMVITGPVSARVQFLQQRAASKAEITAASVIRRLNRNAEAAFDGGDIPASTTALVALGKTMGIFVDVSKQSHEVSVLSKHPSEMSTAELQVAADVLPVEAPGEPAPVEEAPPDAQEEEE
jgi:phage terminase small subunit